VNHKSSKYPEWKKRIGQCRVDRMKKRYEAQGYKVTTFKIEDEGTDMIAEIRYDPEENLGNPEEQLEGHIIGFEITNWNRKGFLNPKRLNEMVKNWEDLEQSFRDKGDYRDFRRRLVYSYDSNIEHLIELLLKAGVELEKIGHQDIPLEDKPIEGWKDDTNE